MSTSNSNTLKIPKNTRGLHILSEPEITEDIHVDIVSVHGLGGDSYSTWTHKNGTLWLYHLLPKDVRNIKNVRVMTFGYNANLLEQAGKARTFTFAEKLLNSLIDNRLGAAKNRPIIFIAHSLGGIVVKHALLIAHQLQERYGDIISNVWHVMFFGTPHQGVDGLKKYVLNLGTAIGLAEGSSALGALELWSPQLIEITTLFSEIAGNFTITTIWETKKTNGVTVVKEGSARLGQKTEKVIGFEANHHQICKFEDGEDENYRLVRDRLRFELSQLDTEEAISERNSRLQYLLRLDPPRKMTFMVDYKENPLFVPRKSDKNGSLEYYDALSNIYKNSKSNVAFLYGTGGTGKTSIALDFCYRQKFTRSIYWVYAGDNSELEQGLIEIAKDMRALTNDNPSLEQIMKSLKSKFEALGSEDTIPLLVLDNVDVIPSEQDNVGRISSQEVEIVLNNLPNSGCQVLITSRSLKIARKYVHDKFSLPVRSMSDEEAAEMLNHNLDDIIRSNADKLELGQVLGNLPLAIKHASSYIRKYGFTINEYINRFKSSDNEAMDLLKELDDSRHFGVEKSESVFKTFSITFKALTEQASTLLSLLSQFSNIGVYRMLFTVTNEDRNNIHVFPLQDDWPMIIRKKKALMDAIAELRELSLIHDGDEESGTLFMHRLVHKCARWMNNRRAGATDNKINIILAAQLLVNYDIYTAFTAQYLPPFDPRVKYIFSNCLELIATAQSMEITDVAITRLKTIMATCYYISNDLERSLEVSSEAARECQELYNTDEYFLLYCLCNKSRVLFHLGRQNEAIALDEKIVEALKVEENQYYPPSTLFLIAEIVLCNGSFFNGSTIKGIELMDLVIHKLVYCGEYGAGHHYKYHLAIMCFRNGLLEKAEIYIRDVTEDNYRKLLDGQQLRLSEMPVENLCVFVIILTKREKYDEAWKLKDLLFENVRLCAGNKNWVLRNTREILNSLEEEGLLSAVVHDIYNVYLENINQQFEHHKKVLDIATDGGIGQQVDEHRNLEGSHSSLAVTSAGLETEQGGQMSQQQPLQYQTAARLMAFGLAVGVAVEKMGRLKAKLYKGFGRNK